MTTLTRVQIKLQQDSGSILYQDCEDGVIFHIEAMRDRLCLATADEDADHQVLESREVEAAKTELLRSFLRLHLLKNGEASHSITPLMREESLDPLLDAMTALHLRKDAGRGAGGCGDVGAAMNATYRTFGTMVSMLQQREKILKVVSHLRADCEDDVEGEDGCRG